MNKPDFQTMLTEASRQIADHMGLHFPCSRRRNLEQAFTAAARDLDFPGPEECIAWFLSAPPSRELIEAVAAYLTIGESYFLRESGSFEILTKQVIPEMIRTRPGREKRLRIWSAGCSTGEEPYTMAILLQRMGDALKGCDVSILATDINPRALRKAIKGEYTEWSFRSPPPWLKTEYFSKTGEGRYEILPEIRKMVSFGYFNLVEDLYPSLLNNTNAMDLIFCRNVLMYFTPEWAGKVIERFRLCLVEGGWLVVSPCETSQLLSSSFAAVNFPGGTLYRKEGPGAAGGKGAEPQPAELLQPLGSVRGTATGHFHPPDAAGRPPAKTSNRVKIAAPPAASADQMTADFRQTARDLYEAGEYGAAAKLLADCLALESGDSVALALLCRIRANEGRLAEALLLSERALAADKLNAGLHYLRAGILQEQGAVDEAAATLKQALYLDQELVLAHFALGNLALRQGKAGEARKYFENSLSLLERYGQDDIIPESEGIFAGRLREIIRTTAVSM